MELPKLLYVDDESLNLQLFKFNFQSNFELSLAKSGAEALEILESSEIKIIISDLKMPEMNGIELINIIKNKFPDKVCMMLSAYSLAEALEMGLNEDYIVQYINKPWKRDQLLNDIHKYL